MTIAQNELEALQNAPLFLPRYLQKQISITPPIPPNHLEIIQRWQALMVDKTRKHLKGERKLEGDLTIDFFVHILGWHSSTSNNPTLNSQYSITSETRTPDIALGRFANHPAEIFIVGEYKGPKTDLDIKQKGEGYQNRTPVEQARNYASLESNCQFYLVTNMTEWRLYPHVCAHGNTQTLQALLVSELRSSFRPRGFIRLLLRNRIASAQNGRLSGLYIQQHFLQDRFGRTIAPI